VLQLTVAGYHWLGSNQGLGEVNKWRVVSLWPCRSVFIRIHL
jgi:hypothetical protein